MSGLGNQLFQYAAGRRVADRTRTKLRFDISFFASEPNREYGLGDFSIRADLVDGEPKTQAFMDEVETERAYAEQRYGATFVRQGLDTPTEELLATAPRNSYLAGYWIAERYFAPEAAAAVRRELRPRRTDAIDAGSALIAAASQSVAVHVRRGDMVTDPGSAELFGSMPARYYERAARYIAERRPGCEFFVFSDDPEWCEQTLDLPGPMQVMSGKTEPFEDLTLISRCDNVVVPNSSFSWWGAWLGENSDSLIVVPERPYRDERTTGVSGYPERWIRV
ncbi:MAG: alpha-1,2-fucosyltransferase [Solirubrobacterales bacterium]